MGPAGVPAPPAAARADAADGGLVQPSGQVARILRFVILVGFVLGALQWATTPVERSVGDLLGALANGRVDGVTLERFPDDVEGSGQLRVEWVGDGRPAFAHYLFSTEDDGAAVDEATEILAAVEQSPSPVTVSERDHVLLSGTTWHWDPGALASVAAFLLLVLGPQPRLATKWSWFWLGALVPGAWAAFVVLEPVPFTVREPLHPARTRLTGGAGLAIALLLSMVVYSAVALVVGW